MPRTPILLLILSLACFAHAQSLDLAGDWEVSLGQPSGAAWSKVRLPGVLDDSRLGTPLELRPELSPRILAHLQRRYSYIGPAYYRRKVEIPADWAGRKVVLSLERVLWRSQVYVDGRLVGTDDSLSTPHRYDLGCLLGPGSHELMIMVDNREIHKDLSIHIERYVAAESFPAAHAYTNHTQTIWNGVLGQLSLQVRPEVTSSDLRVRTTLAPKPSLSVAATFSSLSSSTVSGMLEGRLYRLGAGSEPGEKVAERSQPCRIESGTVDASFVWELPEAARIAPWNEFSPQLYRLELRLLDSYRQVLVRRETTLGFRELCARDGSFFLNGDRLFLRGDLECATYPLTGYPPMTEAEWRRLFRQAKLWGLNHLRFHSWCPPETAFRAADELGLYLQIELPHWSLAVGREPSSWSFLEKEADRILEEYGNHPSFAFFSMGNELEGDFGSLERLVRRLRQKDSRHLYTTTTFSFQKGHGKRPEPEDDYLITQYTEEGWVRGQGMFNSETPSHASDYGAALTKIGVPVISHEIGQYSVYPDLSEILEYTGNLLPLNLVAVRDDLARKGLLSLAPQFTQASGRLAALLYKEEIERALRTPQLDGFQLLQLQDFPGQGTALVGLLNSFWKSKGIISSEEFREACSPLTPLARFPKLVYERGECLEVPVEVANYLRDFPAAEVRWLLRGSAKRVVAKGAFGPKTIARGGLTSLGTLACPIPEEGEAEEWELEIALAGTPYRNRWNLWVYPRGLPAVPSSVRLLSSPKEALQALAEGARVVLAPPLGDIKGVAGSFVPVFWSPVHFPDQAGTMGILCDPAHPALRAFPTQSHGDWQWWDPLLRSRSLILDGTQIRPLVRVIDNFMRNHSLGDVLEARVGKGRLLICTIDIEHELEKRPAARQLRTSLLRYAASDDFQPESELPPERFKEWFVSLEK